MSCPDEDYHFPQRIKSEPIPCPLSPRSAEEKKEYDEEEEDDITVRDPRFSKVSVLTGDDRGTQQMIFDRLPLSKIERRKFYKWLLEEHEQHGAVADDGTSERHDEGKQGKVLLDETDGHSAQGGL